MFWSSSFDVTERGSNKPKGNASTFNDFNNIAGVMNSLY